MGHWLQDRTTERSYAAGSPKPRVRAGISPLIAVASMALASCVYSPSRAIKDGTEEDFGDKFDLTFSIPAAADAEEFERATEWGGRIYRGTESVVLRFTRSQKNLYSAIIMATKGDEVRNLVQFDRDVALKTHSDIDGLKLVQIEVAANFSDAASAPPGHVLGHWLVDSNKNAFPGFLTSSPNRLHNANGCAKMHNVLQGCMSFFDPSQLPNGQEELLADFDGAIQHRELVFSIDCSRFPQYSTAIAGFKTQCMTWTQGANGP